MTPAQKARGDQALNEMVDTLQGLIMDRPELAGPVLAGLCANFITAWAIGSGESRDEVTVRLFQGIARLMGGTVTATKLRTRSGAPS